MNTITKKLIVVSSVILVLLVLFTLLFQGIFGKKSQENKSVVPIPTGSFEQRRPVGTDKQQLNQTRARALTAEEKKQILKELAEKNDDLLTSQQLENLNKLKEKLPFSSEDFDIKYSPELNRFFISKKTPQALDKIKQFLKDNNVLDIYEQGHPIFSITDNPVDQAIQETQNDLFEVVGEKDDSETVKEPSDQTEEKQSKELKHITDIMRTLFSFDLGEIEITPNPTPEGGSSQPPENLGDLTCPPNLGKPNSLGYHQMPEPQNNEYVFNEGASGSCSTQRYGRKELICTLYTVALNYKKEFPKSRLRIGDLNASHYEHCTHHYGVGVDITESIGGSKGPAAFHEYEDGPLAGKANPAYNAEAQARTIELGKLFINTKLIRNIYFDDPIVLQALNSYVHTNNIPAEKGDAAFFLENHGDHFHIDLKASLRGPDHHPLCSDDARPLKQSCD